MGKIGRNQPCPCGSGKKYKHCCLTAQQMERQAIKEDQIKVTLMNAIAKIQRAAEQKKEDFFELGVFVFFCDTKGDAWLLEVTDSDAVQVAQNGEALEAPIEENSETIEINWSHTYALRDKMLFLTSYADQEEMQLPGAPTQQINAAMKRVKKRYSQDLLDQVHITQ